MLPEGNRVSDVSAMGQGSPRALTEEERARHGGVRRTLGLQTVRWSSGRRGVVGGRGGELDCWAHDRGYTGHGDGEGGEHGREKMKSLKRVVLGRGGLPGMQAAKV